LEFRDEVYANIASLLEQLDLVLHRAENTTELARQVVRNNPDLILLNGTQPDESAWLTCAKLRIIDSSRPVWIYAPTSASAIDQWLSMASIDEVVVYGGVLDILLSALSDRLSQSISDESSAKVKALPREAF
jgi:CheY-like chemotaxis protein